MRRLFILLFILSLGATVALHYWRIHMPERPSPVSAARPTRHAGPDCLPRTVNASPWGQFIGNRQDLAVEISTIASIVSAITVLLQAWFAARARLAKQNG